MSNAPRCLAPMQEQVYADGSTNGPDPVCWRPRHYGNRHKSKMSWMTEKLRRQKRYYAKKEAQANEGSPDIRSDDRERSSDAA